MMASENLPPLERNTQCVMDSLLIQHGNGKVVKGLIKNTVPSLESRDKSNIRKCHCNEEGPTETDPA